MMISAVNNLKIKKKEEESKLRNKKILEKRELLI